MSATVAAALARSVATEETVEGKINKLADAIEYLARAIADLDRAIQQVHNDVRTR